MKYVQPIGGAVNDPYVDANPGTGVEGSAVPAAAIEHPMREILAVIEAAGLVPDESHLDQLLKAITKVKGVARVTANGSFTVPAGVTKIYVSGCAGGGGGGGGGRRTTTSEFGGGGSSGGAGESAIRVPVTVIPGEVIPITIGGGGAGGITNAAAGGSGGSSGGNTTVGAYLTLVGGGGGAGGSGGGSNAGAYATTGYPPGSDGQDGVPSGGVGTGNGSVGASSPFGGGGGLGRSSTGGSVAGRPGGNAGGYGAGGGGGSTGANGIGGNGSAGLVIIEW